MDEFSEKHRQQNVSWCRSLIYQLKSKTWALKIIDISSITVCLQSCSMTMANPVVHAMLDPKHMMIYTAASSPVERPGKAQVRRSATRTCSCFSWTKVVNSSTSTRREQIDLRHDMAYDTIIQILYGLAWYLYERRVQFPRWSENRLCILEQKLAEHKRFAFWICPKEKWTSLMGKCEGPWPNLYKSHMFCFFFFWTFPQVDWDGLGLRLPFWKSMFHTSHGPIV